MSDIIQLLPDSVANQIAAGEVIQRPASVIKELVENAVDAGASRIDVVVVDAGRTSIQVIDNGKGMSETDARLSFERHATSKIRHADDLFALHTMGFRGEALASIAAVAQVVLKTRQEADEVGTLLTISGSKVEGQEPCSCPVGSNFSINNLFYNVPARRKFLKSNTTELNNILTAFERIVLVYPQITFTLQSNGTELFNLRAGSLRQRIIDVFGKRINQDLLPVKVDTMMCKIDGFVGKPESARKKGTHQYFFVNGRYMKHPYFNKAVMTAFERLVPQGEQVPYFIYFTVAPGDIDVNIHPTKTEIKFENEQAIWQILMASVKESLGMFNDVPTIDFDTEDKPEIPVFNTEATAHAAAPRIAVNPHYNPFKSTAPSTGTPKVDAQWERLYEGLDEQPAEVEQELFADVETNTPGEPVAQQNVIADRSPAHYQYKGRYILTSVKSGLMVIDQARAHCRVLYERYLAQMTTHEGKAQKVLFPEVVQFPMSDDVLVKKLQSQFSELGFELDDLGRGSYAINAIPADLDGINPVMLVQDMVADAKTEGVSSVDEIKRSLAHSLAKAAAIPYGQVLSNEEMETLVNNLFSCQNVNYAPDGKSVLCIIPQQQIEQMLG